MTEQPVRRAVALFLLSFAIASGAAAQGMPAPQKALLLLRVLVYDRNLKARAQKEVRIAVVFRPGHAASEQERDALIAAVEEVADRAVVAGLPVRVVPVPYQDAVDFQARLVASSAVAMYVGAGLEGAIQDLDRVARRRSALTVCGSRELAGRGCAVALVDRGERAALIINTRVAVAQGADLDPRLLSMAERVEAAE